MDGNCWRGRQLKTPRRSISNRTPIFKRMLQNRVDPFGNLIATPYRGAWMGNRGLLHDERQTITRQFRLKAWLICVLQFKDRKRKVMSPGLYTELFFLDEATAFAAGHRPCGECRREDFNRFKTCFSRGNPGFGLDTKSSIRAIDDILHRDRLDQMGNKLTYLEKINNVPNGSMLIFEGQCCLAAGNSLFPWSPSGYGLPLKLPRVGEFIMLTPRSTVNAFRAGYIPQMAL